MNPYTVDKDLRGFIVLGACTHTAQDTHHRDDIDLRLSSSFPLPLPPPRFLPPPLPYPDCMMSQDELTHHLL